MKLDLGCGSHKEQGFVGVDAQKSEGVDVVCDLGAEKWPFADDSVDEARASHVIEHLPGERVDFKLNVDWERHTHSVARVLTYPRAHFFNELWRVLKKGAKATIVTPCWSSCRAYGDHTHQWPPVSEFLLFYLDADWRAVHAKHDPVTYTCNFAHSHDYIASPAFTGRSQEFMSFATAFYKEAAQDMVATVIKK